MKDKIIMRAFTISFITALLVFSTGTAVADSSLDYLENEAPPDGIGPGIPDPGEMTRKIGGFEGKIGSFVSFDTIEDGISDYSLRIDEDQHLSIFDEVKVEEFGKYDENAADHTYFLEGNGAEFQLYDNPSTMLKLDVHSLEESGRRVSFRLGDMEVDEEEDGVVRISNDHYSGNLISIDISRSGRGGPREGNDFIREKDGFINFTVEDRATFVFRMDMDGFQERTRNSVRERIRDGRIGAEFRIESTEEGYSYLPFSYRDVNMKAQMRGENKIEMLVSSSTLGDEGTLLLIDISSTVMDISSKEDIQLLFDGEPATFMGVEEVFELEESDDPFYTLIPGEEGAHLIVNVPSFSTHSITVEYLTETIDQYLGDLMYYIPAATASVGLVLLGLLYRKDDKDKEKKKDKDRRVSIDKHQKNYKEGKGDLNKIESSKKGKKKKETRVRKD